MESTESELRLFARRSRLLVLLGGCVALVAVALWAALSREGAPVAIVGWVGVAFFGGCGVYIGKRLAVRAPVLVIDREGVLDNASGLAVGRLAWGEIAAVTITSTQGQRFLGLFVHDIDALGARLTGFGRAMLRLNTTMGFPPVNIPQGVLPMPIEELADLIGAAIDSRAVARESSAR